MQTSSPAVLRSLMEQYVIYPKKRWGQNFLVDNNILQRISELSGAHTGLYTVEIGPGMGALTQLLAQQSRGVLAIDIDETLQAPLEEVLAPYTNVRLVFADILKVDVEQELARQFQLDHIPEYIVCANIPYNITTPIIFYLLEKCPHMQGATLMMQKEVAQRIIAGPGSKDYGLLTLMTSYYADTRWLLTVSRNCFYPRPEVDSAVLQFTPLPQPRVQVKDEEVFKAFLRTAFQQRRKTILNSCASFFDISKDEAQAKLEQLGIKPNQRPEELSLEEMASLVDRFLN